MVSKISMDNFLVILILVAGVVLTFSIWVRLPYPLRILTLDQLKPSRRFHGLILFGKDGAYVELDQRPSGDHISFTKRFRKDDSWFLEVAVSGLHSSAALLNKVELDLATLGNRFKVEPYSCEVSSQTRFFLTGAGLQDHHALEGIARLLIRHLGHPKSAKYRLRSGGPEDYESVDKHFEREKKKWKGEE